MGEMMEKAVISAIRQGGVKNLPDKDKILVARAMLILQRVPDNPEEDGPKEYDLKERVPLHVPPRAFCGAGGGISE